MTSVMFFEQGITIFDSTAVAGATTGSFVTYGGLSIFNTTQSTGITSGSFVVAGGVGISGTTNGVNSNWDGVMTITDTTQSTGVSDGAFIVNGGAGIAKDLNVGGDATITGNLFVNGTTTSVNSTTISVTDNTFQLNTGPTGTRDAGFLIERYQVDNNAALGDVVNETAVTSGTLGVGNTATDITLPAGFSAVDDTYNNWWVLITSGSQQNEVRQITDYVGSTKVATLSSALTGAPVDSTDTFELYNKSFVAHYYDTATDEYVFGYTSDNIDITTDIYNAGHLNIRAEGAYLVNATVSNLVATNMSAGSLTFTDATISNLYVTNDGTIANAYLNDATVGNLVVNNVNITPSSGDIGTEATFSAANNQASPVNVTGLAFANGTVRSFISHVSVTILTSGDVDNRYASYTLHGVQKISGGWVLNSRFVGDNTGVHFSIDTAGQVKYTSTNVASFLSDTMKFKADTTSV